MGKTSLANYIIDVFERKYKLIGVQVINDSIHDLDSLIQAIIERILNKIESESWSDKIINTFKDNIESVGVMNTTIKFRPNQNDLKNIRDNFPFFLKDLTDNFKDKNGLIIIIDDINGLSENPDFANWYKNFADTMATNDFRGKCPFLFILEGYPEKLHNLYNHNPSFQRIFKIIF